VRGYEEKGNINSPQAASAWAQASSTGFRGCKAQGPHVKEKKLQYMQIKCRNYAYTNGIDNPAVADGTWPC
jgi:xylulose-5-phosphate/fructose-6-phosphate phosphoketolase